MSTAEQVEKLRLADEYGTLIESGLDCLDSVALQDYRNLLRIEVR